MNDTFENSNGAHAVPMHILAADSGGDDGDGNLSFEEALRELEEVVNALETGNVPLEQSIALLRRGLALADGCDATLSQAELTLEQLLATPDGELITERLGAEEGDEDVEESAEDEEELVEDDIFDDAPAKGKRHA